MMPAGTLPSSHIRLDDQGRAWVAGTPYRVSMIALDHLKEGWSPEEIRLNHHDALTLGQIHAALAFYFDHRADVDAEIRQEIERAETMRQEARDVPPGGARP